MCTASWFRQEKHYEVFFNRDERNTRLRAEPPKQFMLHGTNIITPKDTDAGGTWIACNEYGVTLCLLNNYSETQNNGTQYKSRGEIILAMANYGHADLIIEKMEKMELHHYRPFQLIIFDLHSTVGTDWNGKDMVVNTAINSPASSSSYQTQHVLKARFDSYNMLDEINGKTLEAWHRSHWPDRSAESVCMRREDAHTVSYSHINVKELELTFAYTDGPPCTNNIHTTITIPRRNISRSINDEHRV